MADYNEVDPEDCAQHVDQSSMANHDSLYSNPNQAARHLVEKYDRETAEDHFRERGYDEERVQALVESAVVELSKSNDTLYERIDTLLLEAIEGSSWWVDGEFADGSADLSEAPGIWRESDRVPEYVREAISEVVDGTSWDWARFESLTIEEGKRLEDLVERRLTQPQGWSVESIVRDVQREFFTVEEAAVGIAADATHNVLNVARERVYEDVSGSEEFVYSWVGPSDHRTTPVCAGTKEKVGDRGGAVTMPTLKQLLRETAAEHEDAGEGGGTAERVDVWEPHARCRHTFVRGARTVGGTR
jgi:AcrR family transcriptional regulator